MASVSEICEKLNLKNICMPAPEKQILCGYTGDLLSFVMGRAPEGCAWVTIMTNINIIAVASLRDASVIIVSEGEEVPADVIAKANEMQINLLSSEKNSYEICAALSKIIS